MSTHDAWTRLTLSAMAIIHLHELGEITEGQAVKLMNCTDIVSYRLRKEELEREMRDGIAMDMKSHGWKRLWPSNKIPTIEEAMSS